jgi:hypothetical protein
MLVGPLGKLSNRGPGVCRLKCGASRCERAKICCAHDHLISSPIRRGRCRQEQNLAHGVSTFEGSPPDVIWTPTACQALSISDLRRRTALAEMRSNSAQKHDGKTTYTCIMQDRDQ